MTATPVTPVTAGRDAVGHGFVRGAWRWIALVAALAAAGARPAEAATARIQYVSSGSVYLDAGRAAGLAEGAHLRVERQGQVVGELVVEFVAENSAACKVLSATAALAGGDLCVFEAPAARAPGTTSPTGPQPPPGPSTARDRNSKRASGGSAVRGSLAFVYREYSADDATSRTPAVRANVRWEGDERQRLEVRVYATHQALDLGAATSNGVSRLYDAALRYRAARDRFGIDGGRFVPERLEWMGSIDGAAAAVRPLAGLRLGFAGGRAARLEWGEPSNLGQRWGGFLEANDARPQGPVRWRVVAGGVRLQDASVIQRQFGFLRTDARLGARVRAYDLFEVDVNPAWKRRLGEPHVTLTSWGAGTDVSLPHNLEATVGVDSRRDEVLPQIGSVPIVPAPVSERTNGINAGLALRPSLWSSFRVRGDVRTRSDGSRATRSWDASVAATPPQLRQVTGILHVSLHDSPFERGEITDASLSYAVTSMWRCDVAAGSYRSRGGSTGVVPGTGDPRRNWLRLGADLQLGGGTWLSGSGEWRSQAGGRDVFVEAGRRF